MGSNRTLLYGAVAVALLCVLPASALSGAERSEFPLAEASAFGADATFMRGHPAECVADPESGVKYPHFESTAPIYGKVAFDGSFDDSQSGITYHFAVDESKGPGKGYDRLYFDLNRNSDLTDDAPLSAMPDPPKGAIPSWQGIRSTCFSWLDVPFDYGEGVGVRPFRVLPRLGASDAGYRQLYFVSPVVRQGDIKIGIWKYKITLAQAYAITCRFDRPLTYVVLSGGPTEPESWYGNEFLGAMRFLNGKLYRFSTTPLGDKLTVEEYMGDFGVLKLGAGDRKVDKLQLSGMLQSTDTFVVIRDSSGKSVYGGPEASISECRLPVGDYTLSMVGVELGRLGISVSNNYHSDGHPKDRQGRAVVYGVKIRQDAPFVLDFSNKPEVVFASPARDTILKPGDTLETRAFLIDPVLDIMIRSIYNRADVRKQTFKFANGTSSEGEAPTALTPVVTITDASGKQIASGVMPFG